MASRGPDTGRISVEIEMTDTERVSAPKKWKDILENGTDVIPFDMRLGGLKLRGQAKVININRDPLYDSMFHGPWLDGPARWKLCLVLDAEGENV